MGRSIFVMLLILLGGLLGRPVGAGGLSSLNGWPLDAETKPVFDRVYGRFPWFSQPKISRTLSFQALRSFPVIFLTGPAFLEKEALATAMRDYARDIGLSVELMHLNLNDWTYFDLSFQSSLIDKSGTSDGAYNPYLEADLLIIDSLERHQRIVNVETGQILFPSEYRALKDQRSDMKIDYLSDPLSEAESTGLIRLIENRTQLGKGTIINSSFLQSQTEIAALFPPSFRADFRRIFYSDLTLRVEIPTVCAEDLKRLGVDLGEKSVD